jgi:hypothetical protein
MATLNMLRGLLVAAAALAVVIALALGQWAAAVILSAGIVMHGALWVRLHREKAEAAAGGQTPGASGP